MVIVSSEASEKDTLIWIATLINYKALQMKQFILQDCLLRFLFHFVTLLLVCMILAIYINI